MPAQNQRIILTVLIIIVFFAYSASIASGIEEKITPELREKSISSPEGYAKVIIKMKGTPAEKSFSAKSGIMKIRASASVESLMENRKVLKTNSGGSEIVAADMRLSDLDALAADTNVEYIVEDRPVHALLSESVPLIGANSVWSQQIFDENITGAGAAICIIDTGVDYTHPDLGNCTSASFLAGNCTKVIAGYDFVNNNADPMDDNGHGTHVSGIVAANGTLKGVAPDAKIVAIKVLNSNGGGTESDVISGIGWCVSNSSKFNISVISMSLGGDINYPTYCDGSEPAFRDAINEAIAKNISVVVATGNDDSITGVLAPACIKNATRAGATTKSDAFASFTSRGTGFPDMLLAPGAGINSTRAGALCPPYFDCAGNYMTGSGTSMATPHVSGAIALLSQEYRKIYGTSETPQYFKSILNSTGKRIYDSGTGIYFPRINVSGAYDFILSNVPAAIITINSPQNGSFTNANYSIINASQTLSSQMNFSIDSGENISACPLCNSFTNSTGNLSDGLHNITVYGSNILGAINSTTSYFTIDTTPPEVEFTNLAEENNSILDRSWIFANISIAEINFKNATASLFNSSGPVNFTQIAESGEHFINWTSLADGMYYYNVTAYDMAGNMNYTKARMITLDTTKPNLEIIAPENTTYNSIYRALNYTAEDKNLNAVWYEYNETNRTPAIGQTGLNPLFTALDNRQSTLTLYANDTLGHISSASVTFTVDTIYPQIYFTGETKENNNTYWNRTWIYANVSATDENFKNMTFSLYNNALINSITYTDDTRSVNWTNQLEDGTYYFNATVYDAAGNMNYTETLTITLDTKNPAIAFAGMTPENNSRVTNWAYINITSNEPLSSALLEWNGITPNLTMQGSGKNWYLNKTMLTSSNYTFRVYANDMIGNWNATEIRTIFATCTESWSYSAWSACSGGTQARTATDSNSCGTTVDRSALSQSCTRTPPPSGGGGGGYGGSIVPIAKNTTNSTNASVSFKANDRNISVAKNKPLNATGNSSAIENSSSDITTDAPNIESITEEDKNNPETAFVSTTGNMVLNYLKFVTYLVNQFIVALQSWI